VAMYKVLSLTILQAVAGLFLYEFYFLNYCSFDITNAVAAEPKGSTLLIPKPVTGHDSEPCK